MPSTPRYAFPYPSLADPPDGPKQLGALAEKIEATLATVESVVNQQITRRYHGSTQGGEVSFSGADTLLAERVTLHATAGHTYLVAHTTQSTKGTSVSPEPFITWYYRYAEGASLTPAGTSFQHWVGPPQTGAWTTSTRHAVWTAPSTGQYTLGVSASTGSSDNVRSSGRLTITDIT